MKDDYPDKTVFYVALLVSEKGEKKLMIAEIPDDDKYENNRNSFLTIVWGKCRLERCVIEELYSFRSKEEYEAYMQQRKAKEFESR